MSTRRTKIRRSLLALLVAYLRESTTNTAKFTTVEGVGGAYPFTQRVWTFSLGSNLYQIAQVESAEQLLPTGVTIFFGIEKPTASKAMPQEMKVEIGISIRTPAPRASGQEGDVTQIALKIDQALYRAAGRVPIKDYDVNPAIDSNTYLEFVSEPRGNWEFVDPFMEPSHQRRKYGKGSIQEMRLAITGTYYEPSSEL